MRAWRYNKVFYMERKRDLIISWQYESLAMNQGAIKQGFTEHVFHVLCIYISYVWVDNIKNCLVLVTNVNNILQCITIHLTCNVVYIWCLMYILFFHTTCHLSYVLYPTILIWHHITTHPLCQCPWSQQNHLLIQHCLSSSHPGKKTKTKVQRNLS